MADISSFGHNNDDRGLSGGVEAPVDHDFLRLDRGWQTFDDLHED